MPSKIKSINEIINDLKEIDKILGYVGGFWGPLDIKERKEVIHRVVNVEGVIKELKRVREDISLLEEFFKREVAKQKAKFSLKD